MYNEEGVWAKEEDGKVRVGLSDFVQQRSGDVAFAEIKPVETAVAISDELAVIETIKVNVTYTSPVTGNHAAGAAILAGVGGGPGSIYAAHALKAEI